MTGGTCVCARGPGYATPLDAFHNGPRETLLYVPAVVPDKSRPDYLVTIDADPSSETYSQVIHRLPFPYLGDELHHTGWNACSSVFNDSSKSRKYLVLPTLATSRVYGVDVATDPRAPKLAHIVEPEEIAAKTGLTFLHTSHCLGTGEILISALGDTEGNAKGGFLVLDEEFKIKGTWSPDTSKYGYDYWYQPRHNILVATSWGAPNAITKGFNPAEVPEKYGDELYFYDWTTHKLIKQISLGPKGLIPLEVRFLHDPDSVHAYTGTALSSNIVHIFKDESGEWTTDIAIEQTWVKLEGWVLPELPPLISDILISLDDKFIYFSNWLRGDIAQYDISDPAKPKFVSRIFLGGVARKGSPYKVLGGLPDDVVEIPEIPTVKGKELQGGPQMIQLSLDGKRLYVTNSLYSVWDNQFYPDLPKKGSYLLQVDIDTEKGGLSLNPNFFIDFGAEPDGPVLAHEVRYPGGDSSSDIWI